MEVLALVVLLVLLPPAASTACSPDIHLASMFQRLAVLQRAPATPLVYGTAPPGARLAVTVAGRAAVPATADAT